MGQVLNKLASAIRNDIVSGLRGYHHNMSLSVEQLEDDIIDERLRIINEYINNGNLPYKDLLQAINCIPVDCKDLDRCPICRKGEAGKPTAHFEIPQLVNDYGINSIYYIGSTDRMNPFLVYNTPNGISYYQKYRRRGKNKPYVYIDTVPNENGMYDGYIFNAPLIRTISIEAIFKDPRQLDNYGCCSDNADDNFNFLSAVLKERVTKQKILYYRQMAAPLLPNDQQYNPA